MVDQTVTPFGVANQYRPGSPEWWFQRLACGLRDRREGRLGGRVWARDLREPTRVRPGLERLHDYLVGDPPLIGFAEGWGDAFREICRLGRLNMAENIVNAKSARMTLRGFRTSAANDDLGDQKAREIMRATGLKVKAREIHDYMLWARTGYAMVTPPSKPVSDGGMVGITAEDPRYTIVVHDPATGKPMAGLKLYRDDWDYSYVAHMYLALDDGGAAHFPLRKTSRYPIAYASDRMADGWELTDTVALLPRFPMIAFHNRGGRGEYEFHLDTLDRINDQVMNKLVIAKVQAFRQMVIKGLPDTATKIGEDGEPKTVELDYTGAFEAAPGSLWQVPAGVEFWESTPTDLGPLRLAIKDELQHLGAATGTSLPSMTPDAAAGSAEGASLMREQEVFATEACMDHAEVGWAELMSVALEFMDDPGRANVAQVEPMWGPTERYTLGEKAQAASQAATTLPRQVIWTDIYQYDPADVPRLRQLQGADLLTAAPAPTGPAPAVTFLPPGQNPPPALPAGPTGA